MVASARTALFLCPGRHEVCVCCLGGATGVSVIVGGARYATSDL